MSSLNISVHAEQVKRSLSVTFMAEHFWKLFVELALHSAKITSTYTAPRQIASSITHFKREAHYQRTGILDREWRLQTNVTTLMNPHGTYVWLNR